ncbi:MAG: adenylate/guanylate cyclase domain-containing protein [Acidimicrobiia bacterium]|nr:adenylate/guanylate cyclase domain-containing protein [Acidimicrobiia bacterium]
MATTTELDRFVPVRVLARLERDDEIWSSIDGTLCFIDISGFTALSERLAAKGRVGAEELTEVLSRVFGDMLDLVAQRGGTLLKFGGDALLLLFEGPEHAIQAACAAVEMRAALRKAADIPTSVGKVALRMSVGLHSGSVLLFTPEGTHRELIVAGPTVTAVTEMEGTADAGEIVISNETRALLPEGAAAARKGRGWILRWRKSHVAACGVPAFFGDDTATASAYVPTALRTHLAAGAPEPEHRLATVSFVKVVGIDDHVENTDPASTARALQELVANITKLADAEGVTFLATDVDANACKVILVSGVPTTQVDENGRALRVARQVADFTTPFDLKIGVNRGHVFCGEVGSGERSTYTVMGDTVNLAARMMAASAPGAILAAPAVVSQSRTVYETEEVEPFHVKGKTQPVRALSISHEIGSRSIDSSAQGPFVGREVEVSKLRELVRGIEAGTGASVAVSGPTGIGKTRLVDEVIRGSDTRILEVRAEPYGSANPYRPFRDPIRELLGIERGSNEQMVIDLLAGIRRLAPQLEPFAPLLADVAHIDMPPTEETRAIEGRFRQERTADILGELLGSLDEPGLIVVAEDMHWADAATEALVTRLEVETSERPWLVITTTREPRSGNREEMDLQPLDPDAVEALVHAATESAPFRPDVVNAVVDRAGGSPLFAEELVAMVRETGEVSSLPTSLDGVIGSQIDSLEPLARRTLQYVSVLGRSFRTSVARELIKSQGLDLDPATRETLNAFLEDDGADRLQFRHALVRDVAYEGLSYRRRKELHLRAGALVLNRSRGLEESVADILGLHFYLGGDADSAWRFCTMAGDRNMELYANVEAATQYERAIDAARRLELVTDDDRRDVLIKLGDVRERAGDFSGSLEAYRRATLLTRDDPEATAGVLLRRARAKERAGRFAPALSDVTRARRAASEANGSRRAFLDARALALAATIRQAQQNPRAALEVAAEAVDAAETVGDDLAAARAYRVMDYALVMLGRVDEAVHSERSLEIYRTSGMLGDEAATAANLGAYDYWRGDWTGALERYEEGRASLEKLGNNVNAAETAANIGEVLVNQGRFDEAEEPLVTARRTYVASDFSEGVAFVDVLLGRMHGQRGDQELAERYLRSAIDLSRGLGLDEYVYEASIRLADAVCRSGDPESALAILDEARSTAPADFQEFFAPLHLRISASVLDASGRRRESIEAFDAAHKAALDLGETFEAALAILALSNAEPAMVDDQTVAEATATLRTLGVRRVPSLGLVIDR